MNHAISPGKAVQANVHCGIPVEIAYIRISADGSAALFFSEYNYTLCRILAAFPYQILSI